MNNKTEITMNYRIKYLAIAIIGYWVIKYAVKMWSTKDQNSPLLG